MLLSLLVLLLSPGITSVETGEGQAMDPSDGRSMAQTGLAANGPIGFRACLNPTGWKAPGPRPIRIPVVGRGPRSAAVIGGSGDCSTVKALKACIVDAYRYCQLNALQVPVRVGASLGVSGFSSSMSHPRWTSIPKNENNCLDIYLSFTFFLSCSAPDDRRSK
jgi:hypothetical protein